MVATPDIGRNPHPEGLPLLVVLMGPTASGKTALSLAVAEQFDGEIVSCDSVAVYRGMEIGTARPSLAERCRVPHHLIDIADPDQPCTAGDYSRLARTAIAEISARGRLPIVTGGTGLYLRALLDGLFAGPQRSESLRERLRRSEARHGQGWLHRILRRIDPASAAAVHPNDSPKLIRAIEVTIAGRQPLSEAWQAGRHPLTGYRILRVGLNPDRPALYDRIDARAAAMFEQGLVEETAKLLARYVLLSEAKAPVDSDMMRGLKPPSPSVGAGRAASFENLGGNRTAASSGATTPQNSDDSPSRPIEPPAALNSLGYRQAAAFLRGAITLPAAVAAAQQGHRNYAKRQMTWFRREPGATWLRGFGDDPEIRQQALDLIRRNSG